MYFLASAYLKLSRMFTDNYGIQCEDVSEKPPH